MYLIAIDIETRVIIGISGMVILFTSFLLSFVISHRKKLRYHKDLHKLLTAQNELLEKGVQQRTAELSKQKEELQNTLTHLELTQAQLIHSEKMASLGELAAGVAHEIQNPLNFINNFSEVNSELIDELKFERLKAKGERNEELEEEILSDIRENEVKIAHHGKRADAIIKGMLQHSRTSGVKKEKTIINSLINEYLHICYQGLKAKDMTFNATLETNFDATADTIDVIPQDIGMVIFNLFSNAFYSIAEKQKIYNSKEDNYNPTVSVTTKRISSTSSTNLDQLEIIVRDNGTGIPQKVVDKIFQPFYTTKPTGQGTGLGLSMSYDVIKAHAGKLKVETNEGEGATFIIILPY